MMMKSKLGLRKCLYKWKNIGESVLKYTIWGHVRDWNVWSCLHKEECYIPKDVPKGHLVVYVGEDYCRRFVIKVSLLEHPLLRALLDRAEEVFDFSSGSKLCIPCNENIFTIILQYVAAASQQDHRRRFCF
ncbi:Auxin responsive SAUR protein [Corchorus olitorius]|uniref:Auxin responsive SAUR protein n=1 Tax=Corchorus olitorius TaxID=93759 RepID=A0A1R3FUS3_9ROSI|nr:Auxin responsive SAUR protein [Corchorus olitorius]